MTDATNDPADDQSGRFVSQPNGRPRPLSPHLQVWRFHTTMAASIASRIAGVALAGGAVLLAAWLGALAFGPDAHAAFADLSGSPFGLLVWFGMSLLLIYHLLSGLRHLLWDTGRGLSVGGASLLSNLSFIATAVLTTALWIGLVMTGKVGL